MLCSLFPERAGAEAQHGGVRGWAGRWWVTTLACDQVAAGDLTQNPGDTVWD